MVNGMTETESFGFVCWISDCLRKKVSLTTKLGLKEIQGLDNMKKLCMGEKFFLFIEG